MRFVAILAVLGGLASFFAPPTPAQIYSRGVNNGVVSPTAASRLGLTRAWFTQIDLDRSQDRVIGVVQHVSTKKFHTVFVINTPDGEEEFDEHMVDRWGDALGLAKVEEAAKARLAELKAADVDAKLKTVIVPEITLYAQTDRGTLHAVDGATGKSKWVVNVGQRNRYSLPPGANDKYVAALNGSMLYILDQENGTQVWSRQLKGAPGAGAALSEEHVYVPTVSGKMEVYDLEDRSQPPWYYQSTGRLLVQPTVSTNSVSWATDRGFLYVGERSRYGVRFRLETGDPIVSHSTFLPPNRLYAVSMDGYAYCLHEFNGDVIWKSPIGDPISQPPLATRDAVYVVGEGSGLFRLDPDNGRNVHWISPRITKVLAASEDRVYCVGRNSRLVILDAKTGGRIETLSGANVDLHISNWQTDRIFIGTTTGVLQCLHEIGAKYPTVHNIPDPEESQRPEVIQRTDADKPADEGGGAPKDPFGGPADPFGGPADPFGGGAKDPFGGGDAGGGDAPKDPFGGSDPFGGGGDAGGGEADDDAGGADPFGGNPFGG